MQNIELREVTLEEYEEFLELVVRDYANAIHLANNCSFDDAKVFSLKSFERYLPFGPKTEGQFIYTVLRNNFVVGYVWYSLRHDVEKLLYIGAIHIFKEHRSKGYGKEIMSVLEKKAVELKAKRIELNIFTSNKHAGGLYSATGFVEKSKVLGKRL